MLRRRPGGRPAPARACALDGLRATGSRRRSRSAPPRPTIARGSKGRSRPAVPRGRSTPSASTAATASSRRRRRPCRTPGRSSPWRRTRCRVVRRRQARDHDPLGRLGGARLGRDHARPRARRRPDDPDYLLAPGGVEKFVRHNPYTEWYQNSLSIDGTRDAGVPRRDLRRRLSLHGLPAAVREAVRGAGTPTTGHGLFAETRARYVVFVTKHHDGYALWPTCGREPEPSGLERAARLRRRARRREPRALHAARASTTRAASTGASSAPPIQTALDFLDTRTAGSGVRALRRRRSTAS